MKFGYARVSTTAQDLRLQIDGAAPTSSTIVDHGQQTCVKGCYRCLLTYFNQPDHEAIDRRDPAALMFLCQLAGSTVHADAAPVASDLTPANEPATAADSLQSALQSAGLPIPKVKLSGSGWQFTWSRHLVVALLGNASADRQTLKDMDYQVFEIPLDESRWPAAIEGLKAALGD